ncbi:MAG: type 4a pilus biogenesis protein PilO [Tatlockia sp.]|nr:type 4a pilus biogenesis protein PilO [Tatlockia sp.]
MKTFNLNQLAIINFASWPPMRKYVLLTLLPIFIIILNHGLFFYSGLEQYKILADETLHLKKAFEKKQQLSNLEAQQTQLSHIKKKYAKSLSLLVKEKELSKVLNKISSSAASSDLLIEFLVPKSRGEDTLQKESIIRIEALGDYHGLATFYSKITSLSKLITFDNFEIQTEIINNKINPLLRMKISANIHRFYI